ncbi:TKL protein kinase [Saprolegnia diclina VS20]|uniref:TKL protein kinase n=1 Tax=Saprolegnia diclina (strain VS20) TaxID=1156394 RepID=T0RP75_SAPDV|nr:TKL protein kinase [Saprolegnia diclina VS20]EQC31897.1 TKL protein kinase [Saprolegnia diclina VS20]|eukprot:XP_008614625.1 TKL protein kinase [Saprolegnia diclina VS20]
MLAAHSGHDAVVQQLLDRGADIDLHQWNAMTPLMAAASAGSVAVASILLAANANVADLDKMGCSAMHYAASNGHAAMLRALMSAGANLDVLASMGQTPLYMAAENGHATAMMALLEAGANVHAGVAVGASSLIVAAANGHLEAVECLLAAKIDVNATSATTGATALCMASANGHDAIVRRLAYARANLDQPALDGSTPLSQAIANGHARVVDVLQDVRDKKMKLLRAVRHGDLETTQAFLTEGLSVNENDEHGNTLVHLAVLGQHDALLDILLAQEGVQTTPLNKFGETPIMIAIKMANETLVTQLHHAQATPAVEILASDVMRLGELGRGGYGVVYKGSLHNHDVAVKTLKDVQGDAASLRREMAAMEANASPYLLRLLATVDIDSTNPQLVLEYMDGGDLSSYLDKVANDQAVAVGYSSLEVAWVVANALNDLHAKDVVHRDIKTDNILLSSTQYIKVADVGIAKKKTSLMTTGAGTNKWMAPEVLISGSNYGTPADMFSFGVLLETLFPDMASYADADNTPWYAALHARCKATAPETRPTAADVVQLLRPELQQRPELIVSRPAFVADLASEQVSSTPTNVLSIESNASASAGPRPAIRTSMAVGAAISDMTPEQAFLRAVYSGDVDGVIAQLDDGVHPDCATEIGETALVLAVSRGHTRVVDLLLARGANTNLDTADGTSVLHVVVAQKRHALLETLVAAGANVNARNGRGDTPLHAATRLDDVALVEQLLASGADPNLLNDEKALPLHDAAGNGRDIQIVTALLARMRNVDQPYGNDGDNFAGATALYMAAMHDHAAVVDLLLNAGANVNADAVGESPLFTASSRGHADVVRKLLASSPNVNAVYESVSALYVAVHEGHADVVAALLAAPGIQFDQDDMNGETLLHVAVAMDNTDVVRVLLNAGFDINATNKQGQRPIEYAGRLRNTTMMGLMTDASDHKYALQDAANANDLAKVRSLLSRPFNSNAFNKMGDSLAHLAVRAHDTETLACLIATPGIHLEEPDLGGRSPMAVAIQRGYLDMAETLFRHLHQPVQEITGDDYEMSTEELGAGGQAVVYRGTYQGRKVATKKSKGSKDGAAMLCAEADAMTKCPSPYLVSLLAVADRASMTPALLLDYMDMGTLRGYLDQKRWRQVSELQLTNLEVAWVVANAMKDLHALGIVHRDIKSDNVLLSLDHYIKLGDLGIAKVAATYMTDGRGTARWTAPEVLRVDGERYGTEADIYSFGVLLTELDTLELPFHDATDLANEYQIKEAVLAGRRPTLTESCESWLHELATQCLETEPSKRPTANEIVKTLAKRVAKGPVVGNLETFHRAVAANDVASVQKLLLNGFDPNYTVKSDTVPLPMAVSYHKEDVAQLLLDHGAFVDSYCEGCSGLHDAASDGNWSLVKLLLDSGANVDLLDKKHRSALYRAVKNDHESIVRLLLDAGADATLPNKTGKTPLALAKADDDLIEYVPLLEGAEAAHAATSELRLCAGCDDAWHPIEAACAACGHDASLYDKVSCLVRRFVTLHHRGVPIDWTRTCVPCSRTMFMLETCPGCQRASPASTDELKMLLKRLWFAATKPTTKTPALRYIAAWFRRRNAARKLAASTDLDKRNAEYGHMMALIDAIEEDNMPRLVQLLAQPTTPTRNDCYGNSLVHHAVKQNNLAMLQVLLAAPGIPIDHQNNARETPLAVAIAAGAADLVRVLYTAMCPPTDNAAMTSASAYVRAEPPSVHDYILRHKLDLQVPGSRLQTWPTKLQLAFVAANALADLHAAGRVHGSFSSYSLYADPYAGTIHTLYPGYVPPSTSMAPWTAPEVRVAQLPPTPASDMYALGVFFTELDTLLMPTVQLGRLRDDCEPWYADIVARCTTDDPTLRLTAADVVTRLQPHVDAATKQREMFRAFDEATCPLQMDVITKLLDDGLHPNAVFTNGQSVLCAAILSVSPELVRFMLSRGADVNHPLGPLGTPLLFAASRIFSYEILAILINAGADIHAVHPVDGDTPLINAVFFGNPLAVAQLVYSDLSTLLARDKEGKTALEIARTLREEHLCAGTVSMRKQPVDVAVVLEDAERWRVMLLARDLPMTTARFCADCSMPLSIEDLSCRTRTCGAAKVVQSVLSSAKNFFSKRK